MRAVIVTDFKTVETNPNRDYADYFEPETLDRPVRRSAGIPTEPQYETRESISLETIMSSDHDTFKIGVTDKVKNSDILKALTAIRFKQEKLEHDKFRTHALQHSENLSNIAQTHLREREQFKSRLGYANAEIHAISNRSYWRNIWCAITNKDKNLKCL